MLETVELFDLVEPSPHLNLEVNTSNGLGVEPLEELPQEFLRLGAVTVHRTRKIFPNSLRDDVGKCWHLLGNSAYARLHRDIVPRLVRGAADLRTSVHELLHG